MHARAFQIGRQSKVEQDDTAFGRHQHIGGLDVPVQLAGLVERVDAFSQLPECIPKPSLVEQSSGLGPSVGRLIGAHPRRDSVSGRLSHEADKVGAFDQLHREEPAVLDRDELVEIDQVGMADIAEGAEFVFESNQRQWIDPAHGLECDEFAALLVVCLINDAHSAGTQSGGTSVNRTAFSIVRRLSASDS